METVAAVRDCSKFQAVVTLSRIPVGAPCQDPSRYLGLSMLLLYGIGVSCSTFEQRFLSSCLRVTETSDQKSRTNLGTQCTQNGEHSITLQQIESRVQLSQAHLVILCTQSQTPS